MTKSVIDTFRSTSIRIRAFGLLGDGPRAAPRHFTSREHMYVPQLENSMARDAEFRRFLDNSPDDPGPD